MRLASFSIIITVVPLWVVPVVGLRLNKHGSTGKKQAAHKITEVHLAILDGKFRHLDCSEKPIYLRGRKRAPIPAWGECIGAIETDLSLRLNGEANVEIDDEETGIIMRVDPNPWNKKNPCPYFVARVAGPLNYRMAAHDCTTAFREAWNHNTCTEKKKEELPPPGLVTSIYPPVARRLIVKDIPKKHRDGLRDKLEAYKGIDHNVLTYGINCEGDRMWAYIEFNAPDQSDFARSKICIKNHNLDLPGAKMMAMGILQVETYLTEWLTISPECGEDLQERERRQDEANNAWTGEPKSMYLRMNAYDEAALKRFQEEHPEFKNNGFF